MKNISDFEDIIGYKFNNKNYLRLALTHSSYANEKGNNKEIFNERIEFLGDAVLEMISSSFLYLNYPDMKEGDLTKLRSRLVCEDALCDAAKRIDLGSYLYLGHGEEVTNGRQRKSILSDAFESVIGAIYLDGGIDNATIFVNTFVLDSVEEKMYLYDSKTALQELVQANYGFTVSYEIIDTSGPEHDKVFTSVVLFGDKQMGQGKGRSKKEAEKNAAYNTIKMIKQS